MEEISSSGYVVDTLEAVVWSLLGWDTDTVGAIAGGLGALYYGFEGIPAEWIEVLKKREWIAELCGQAGVIIGG